MGTPRDATRWDVMVTSQVHSTCGDALLRSDPWMLLTRMPPHFRVAVVRRGVGTGRSANFDVVLPDQVGAAEGRPPRIESGLLAQGLPARFIEVRWGPDGRLALADSSIECVVLRGEPERREPLPDCDAQPVSRLREAWRSLAGSTGPRAWRSQQLAMLHEIRRVLVPEGQFVLLIRNRFDHARFRGRPDPSTGARFASLLPRRLADLYSALATGAASKAWMHSLTDYRRCLRDAGFGSLEVCGLTPTVERPRALAPFGIRGHAWRPDPLHGLERVRRHRCFVPAYALIASVRAPGCKSAAEEIAGCVEEALGAQSGSCRLSNFRITAKNKGIIRCQAGSRGAILKVAFDAAAERGNRRNYEFLRLAAGIPELRGLVPAPVAAGTAGGLHYHVETEARGVLLSSVRSAENVFNYLPRISRALHAVNPRLSERQPEPFTGDLYRRQVLDPLERIAQATHREPLIEQVRALFRSRLEGIPVRPGLAHGDFCDDNLAVSGGEVTGIIDWEDASADGVVALDALNYIEACHRTTARRGSSAVDVLAGLDRWDALPAAEQSFLAEHYHRCGLQPTHHLALTCLYWVRHVADQLDGALASNPAAIEQRIVRPLEHFVERGQA